MPATEDKVAIGIATLVPLRILRSLGVRQVSCDRCGGVTLDDAGVHKRIFDLLDGHLGMVMNREGLVATDRGRERCVDYKVGYRSIGYSVFQEIDQAGQHDLIITDNQLARLELGDEMRYMTLSVIEDGPILKMHLGR